MVTLTMTDISLIVVVLVTSSSHRPATFAASPSLSDL